MRIYRYSVIGMNLCMLFILIPIVFDVLLNGTNPTMYLIALFSFISALYQLIRGFENRFYHVIGVILNLITLIGLCAVFYQMVSSTSSSLKAVLVCSGMVLLSFLDTISMFIVRKTTVDSYT